MLYLSELLYKPVQTAGSKKNGRLTDLVFVTSEIPYITKIQVTFQKQEPVLFPVSAIQHIHKQILIEQVDTVPLAENEVYMAANVLDQQVIDIQGKNIVRVNDVVILEKPNLVVSGIDIGLSGILRWFGIEKPTHKLLPWNEIQPLELTRGKVVLNKEETKLTSIPPEDLADYLEKTSIHNALKILSLVNKETASDVVQNLNIHFQTQIFRRMTPQTAAHIVTYADPDEAADLLLTVSLEKQKHILELLEEEKRKELNFLLSHSSSEIGEIMTTDYITFTPDMTVKTVLDILRKEQNRFMSVPYGYVINKKEELIGVFSLHELILQTEQTQLVKFMNQNVLVVHLTTPTNIALKRMLKYKLQCLPVMNERKNILGLVTFDDAVEPILQNI